MSVELSFVILLAYDHRRALDAVRAIYPVADEIVLGLDRDRISFTGNLFAIDLAAFNQQIASLDPQKKVRLIEDDFHSAASPIENETHERNILAGECTGRWIVQVDSDEIILNPKSFRKWLLENPGENTIWGRRLTVFKVIGDSYLIIDGSPELAPLATMRGATYTESRRSDAPNVAGPARILHAGLGRSADEVRQKLANSSYSDRFDPQRYFDVVWDRVTLGNYQEYRDFHPFAREKWQRLRRVQKSELPEIQEKFAQNQPFDWPDSSPAVVMGMSPVDRPAQLDAIETAVRRNITAKRIIELGCGTGNTGAAMKGKLGSKFYAGVETDAPAAAIARSKLDFVHFVDDLQNSSPAIFGTDFEKFDLLVALDVLDRLRDPWAVLSRWRECLQPEGLAIFGLANLQHIETLAHLVEGHFATDAGDIGDLRRLRQFTRFGFEDMLKRSGFELVVIDSILPGNLDLAKYKETGNTLSFGRITLNDLTLQEVIAICSRRLYVIARRTL